ncbi:hypothetical protein CSE16_02640 [Solibacillus sp. R5-41]|nr:hypothetical protein CSE16_02640 [Solibacillus sp. R5-41]
MSGKNTSRYTISTGALVDFTGLTNLNLSGTGISELGGLVALTSLITLDISGNQISDLGALANLSNLSTLNVSRTNIADLNVLVKENSSTRFTNLVNLQATNISTLTSIAGLVHVSANATQNSSVKWDFTGSKLTSPDAQNHIDQINASKNDAVFIAPIPGA